MLGGLWGSIGPGLHHPALRKHLNIIIARNLQTLKCFSCKTPQGQGPGITYRWPWFRVGYDFSHEWEAPSGSQVYWEFAPRINRGLICHKFSELRRCDKSTSILQKGWRRAYVTLHRMPSNDLGRQHIMGLAAYATVNHLPNETVATLAQHTIAIIVPPTQWRFIADCCSTARMWRKCDDIYPMGVGGIMGHMHNRFI